LINILELLINPQIYDIPFGFYNSYFYTTNDWRLARNGEGI